MDSPENKRHTKNCAWRDFTYEVGSGEDIPDCTCKRSNRNNNTQTDLRMADVTQIPKTWRLFISRDYNGGWYGRAEQLQGNRTISINTKLDHADFYDMMIELERKIRE